MVNDFYKSTTNVAMVKDFYKSTVNVAMVKDPYKSTTLHCLFVAYLALQQHCVKALTALTGESFICRVKQRIYF